MIDEFVEDTGWTPDIQTAVAGAFRSRTTARSTCYAVLLIARQRDIEIDPYEDMELTLWDAVDAFGRDFVARARRRIQERSAGGTTSTGQAPCEATAASRSAAGQRSVA